MVVFVLSFILAVACNDFNVALQPGTRPLMVIMWIWRSFDRVKCHGVNLPVEGRMLIQNNVTAARGGVGATLGMIGCPYPFAYIHIIYWVVQVRALKLIITCLLVFSNRYIYLSSRSKQEFS